MRWSRPLLLGSLATMLAATPEADRSFLVADQIDGDFEVQP